MEGDINIHDILESIKKRWQIIVICTLIATIIASVFSFFIIQPQYESSTKLFIGKEENAQSYSQSDISMYQKLLKTYTEVIKTKDVMKASISAADVDISPSEVLANLSVVPVAETQIIEIKYKSKSAQDAWLLLEKIKDEFITVATELVPNVNIKVLEDVSRSEKPVSPNKNMNIAIAVLLGFAIGLGFVFLLEYLDNTYKTKDQLEKGFGIPVIGVIPNYIEGAKRNGRASNKRRRNS